MLPSMWPSEFLEWDKELSMYMHWKHIAHTHVLVHGEPQIRPFGGLQSKVKAFFIFDGQNFASITQMHTSCASYQCG